MPITAKRVVQRYLDAFAGGDMETEDVPVVVELR